MLVEEMTSLPFAQQGNGDHLDPFLVPELLHVMDVPLPFLSEEEVLPHHHRPGAEAFHEDTVEEVVRGDGGETRVEVRHKHHVHVQLFKQAQLLGAGGQVGRMLARLEGLQGVAVEGEHHAAQLEIPRLLVGDLDDTTVPAVDPVEHADGDDGIGYVAWPGVDSRYYFHAPSITSYSFCSTDSSILRQLPRCRHRPAG